METNYKELFSKALEQSFDIKTTKRLGLIQSQFQSILKSITLSLTVDKLDENVIQNFLSVNDKGSIFGFTETLFHDNIFSAIKPHKDGTFSLCGLQSFVMSEEFDSRKSIPLKDNEILIYIGQEISSCEDSFEKMSFLQPGERLIRITVL